MWRRQLSIARLRAARTAPYLAAALAAMRPTEAPGLGTFGVDAGWRLHIDPDLFDRWTLDEVAGVLLHEVSHLLRDHASRRPHHIDPVLWNVCGDLEINDDLATADGVVLPNPLLPSTFGLPDHLTAEQYLDRLTEPAPTLPDPRCGSAAHGVTGPDDPGGPGGPTGMPAPLSDLEADMIRRRTAHQIRAAGTAPGHWRDWADSHLQAVIPWTRLLARIAGRTGDTRRNGGVDHTFRRPSRRTRPGGPTLPSLHGRQPTVGIVIDTSASMTDDDLAAAVTETRAAIRAAGPITLIWCDTTAIIHHKVRRPDPTSITSGGTDMRAGIRAAHNLGVDLTVVITDGHTPWPDQPQPNTIIVLVSDDPAPPPDGWQVIHRP